MSIFRTKKDGRRVYTPDEVIPSHVQSHILAFNPKIWPVIAEEAKRHGIGWDEQGNVISLSDCVQV